ncbi:riboflavin synthase [Salinisphaera sp. USBA-960]|uniref:riboflavin synthase n=1 Tax=Salinisphaera orenii TaxID=856731 RepID=UPI000DBE952A|nr:riboflavin synthase [Salifodinibacter halophilus]NNC25326.1 riboflavin synthase [Salifodinibacter halophilus]
MFTGIITAVGRIAEIEKHAAERRLWIETGDLPLDDAVIGQSIAVDGVCLTVIEFGEAAFAADVSNETASLTTLGDRDVGARVNLEHALAVGDTLGGHLVAGHVDGLGRVHSWSRDGDSWRLVITGDPSLAAYWAPKGSVCVDGISLTVNEIGDDWFGVNIVPHTLAETALGDREAGADVNLEVDLIARYVARQLAYRR